LSDTAPLVVVVSGPSGAGKSTVLSRVLGETDRLRFSVSHTSRAPRPGERDGVDYHFVTAAEFHRLRAEGRFLEWAEVHGDLKGTGCGEYERADRDQVDLLLDLDVQGAAQLRLKFPDAVTAFILPPSWARPWPGVWPTPLRRPGSIVSTNTSSSTTTWNAVFPA